ncbi:hypothetical protein M404DRAFT_508457 [Pisolithus tinctorius Marx 270]|uniref:Uncharacterized protein n=1 Tax=Pisolithus tinctorius Marx 270 TaxID=870435 RepID=A0A0C3K8L8_PISTI|nr:hypothetical protein M404DRAFT_508457 [Pisolithus tinctorius Marx 270]
MGRWNLCDRMRNAPISVQLIIQIIGSLVYLSDRSGHDSSPHRIGMIKPFTSAQPICSLSPGRLATYRCRDSSRVDESALNNNTRTLYLH